MAVELAGNGPMEIPPVPPDTPPNDVIVSLGFDPAAVQAVVVTGESIIGVSSSIPGGPEPVPDPEPEPI